jgi:hypothetical protein
MNKTVILAAALVFVSVGVADASSTRNKHRKRVAQPPAQIACTVIGCVPVPPGCGQTGGRTRGGSPTGGDIIVCPPGVAPFK